MRPNAPTNRALALAALGEVDEAIRDDTRALQLDGTLADAPLNRGILHYQEGRLDAAESDFRRAIGAAKGRTTLGKAHYNLALVAIARGDRPTALSQIAAALADGHTEAANLRRLLPGDPK